MKTIKHHHDAAASAALFPTANRPDARHASRGWQELAIDNFAGGGGASLGIERALGRAVDVSINHDESAVAMHAVNHPATHHVCESVWTFRPVEDLVARYGRGRFTFDATGRMTGGVGLAWFSPDCRHFSRAKGGKPVSKRVRGLAWVVVKWAKLVRPRVILLENVREFEQWGPLVQAAGADGRGLVDADGRPVLMPCRDRKGQTFRRWVAQLRRLGYAVEWRLLDAADYGAPTHRRRLFLVARRDGRPIVWPERTHGPVSGVRGHAALQSMGVGKVPPQDRRQRGQGRRFYQGVESRGDDVAVGGQHSRTGGPPRPIPYRTAAECIDWSDPCPSIFNRTRDLLTKKCRQKPCKGKYKAQPDGQVRCPRCGHVSPRVIENPLAEKTLRRIARGIQRYVLENPRPFIVKVNHGGDDARVRPLGQPLTTITKQHGDALVTPYLCEIQNGSNENGTRAVDRPAHTITSHPKGGGMAVVAPTIVRVAHGDTSADGRPRWGNTSHDVGEPLGTVTGSKDYAVVTASIVGVGGRAGQSPPTSPDAPLNTVTAKGDRAVVAATLVQTGYGEAPGQQPRCMDVAEPLGTVVGGGQKHALVTAFLAKHYGGPRPVPGQEVDRPIGTVTSVDHHALVAAHVTRMNFGEKQWQAADDPLGTVTSQGNKFGLVYAFLTKFFGTAVGLAPTEPLHTVTGRDRFGVVTVQVDGVTYAIADIGMRMLSPRELARAQGFPDSYVLTGTKANQVHKIGNSVCPAVAEAMVRANCPELREPATPSGRRKVKVLSC